MYTGIEAYGGIYDQGWVAIVFFCIAFIVGTLVLLNVFLAIAVKSLDDAKDMKLQREEVCIVCNGHVKKYQLSVSLSRVLHG